MTMHHKITGSRAGFTLIELMVAVVVIGLMASIVSVSWEAILPAQKLNSDVRSISSLIQQARSEAIARASEFWMVYNMEKDQYWILTPFDEKGKISFNETERRPLFKTKLRAGIHFDRLVIDGTEHTASDKELYVRFDAVGSSSDHRIILKQDKPEQWFTIEVLGLTGLIRFHDGIFEREEPKESYFQ